LWYPPSSVLFHRPRTVPHLQIGYPLLLQNLFASHRGTYQIVGTICLQNPPDHLCYAALRFSSNANLFIEDPRLCRPDIQIYYRVDPWPPCRFPPPHSCLRLSVFPAGGFTGFELDQTGVLGGALFTSLLIPCCFPSRLTFLAFRSSFASDNVTGSHPAFLSLLPPPRPMTLTFFFPAPTANSPLRSLFFFQLISASSVHVRVGPPGKRFFALFCVFQPSPDIPTAVPGNCVFRFFDPSWGCF